MPAVIRQNSSLWVRRATYGRISSGASVIPRTMLAVTETLSAALIPKRRCMKRLSWPIAQGRTP